MAATDYADLHNFEYHLESAAVTFLNAETGLDIFRTVIESNVVTPRIEVNAIISQALDPPILHGGGEFPNYTDDSEWVATCSARIVTDNPRGQSDDHALYVSQCRTALMRSASNWDETTLPYYDLKHLRPANGMYEVDGDWNITQLEYELIFEIRRDMWPA